MMQITKEFMPEFGKSNANKSRQDKVKTTLHYVLEKARVQRHTS